MKPDEAKTKLEFIEGLLESLRTSPREPVLWSNVADVLLEAGQFELAVRAYDMALILDPYLHKAQIGLTVALDIVGEDGAKRAKPEVRSTVWAVLQTLETLVRGLREGRRSLFVDVHAIRIQKATERRLAANPDDTEALFMRSAILARQGRFEEATAILDRVARLDPQHPGAKEFRRQVETMMKASAPRTARLRK